MPYMKWIAWPIFILFISFLIGLFIYDKTMETGTIEAKNQKLSTAITYSQETLEDIPDLKIYSESEIDKDYSRSYEWPEFDFSKDLTKEVSHWLEERKSEGFSRITLQTEKVEQYFYQILLEAHKGEEKLILPFVLDIDEAKALTLGDLFVIDDKFKENFYSLIEEKSKGEPPAKEHDFSAYNNWLVDEEVLTVYLGDGADVEIKLALTEFLPFAKDRFVERNSMLAQIVAEEEERKLREEEERRRKEEEERRRQEQKRPAGQIGKYVAFTFDDGPHPQVTPRVLDILSKYGAKATFFMLGSEVNKYPNIVKRIASEGHELGNHSHNHPDLTKMDYASVEKQFSGTRSLIEQVTGINTSLFRPPYGAINSNVISAAGNTGSSLILWSVDSLDWQSRNANAVYNQVMATVQSGSIVLMHDLYPTTADALERVLKTLKDQGFKFVTVSELLQMGGKSGAGPHRGV